MKSITTILLLCIALCCNAQDSTTHKSKWVVNGYIKNLETLSFDQDFKNLVSSNLLHNRLNVKWKPSEYVTLATDFRNRLLWGEAVKSTPDYAALLRNQNEKFNLQKPWINNHSVVLHTNIERLYIDYRKKKWNVRLGRQRINWGVTTTWNPNDIFNTYNFLDFDYEERPGADGAKLQYTFSNSFNTELAYTNTGKKNGNVAAAKFALNRWSYDMQCIAGWFNNHPTLGFGWAGPIKNAGCKGEVQYFVGTKDSSSHLNASIETDYMFKKGWYINMAMLYVQRGLNKPVNNGDDINLKLSPENLMPTQWNFIITTVKEFSPLFSANMSVLYAPGTNLLILFPSLTCSLATNLDAGLMWQSFFVKRNNDFGAINHNSFLRLKWSF